LLPRIAYGRIEMSYLIWIRGTPDHEHLFGQLRSHSIRLLRLTAGESIVERIDNVEDTKGNNGDRGLLRITNIRLIWVLCDR
jgi:hypothetical protein